MLHNLKHNRRRVFRIKVWQTFCKQKVQTWHYKLGNQTLNHNFRIFDGHSNIHSNTQCYIHFSSHFNYSSNSQISQTSILKKPLTTTPIAPLTAPLKITLTAIQTAVLTATVTTHMSYLSSQVFGFLVHFINCIVQWITPFLASMGLKTINT